MRICKLLFLLVLPLLAGVAPPPADQVLERLKSLNQGEVSVVPDGKLKVLGWEESPGAKGERKRISHPIDIQHLFKIESPLAAHYVVQTKDGKFHIGWSDGTDEISVDQDAADTVDEFVKRLDYPPVPTAPAGWRVREVVRVADSPTRIASDGTGKRLYVVSEKGTICRIDPATGEMKNIIAREDYIVGAHPSCLGLCLDRDGRMYVVVNQADWDAKPNINHVTIFRTTAHRDGDPADPKPWFKTEYPYGVDVFNHGVSCIAQGPDGMMYVSSGSRTDHGEKGNDPNRAQIGETENTACIWRLNPKSDKPTIEIFAKGIRNAWGFCWDESCRMFATENGPNSYPPEELNIIEKGKHYGFPFQFSDLDHKAYPDQPDAPAGLAMVLPVINKGPDGGVSTTQPTCSTFSPHSSPAGIVALGKDFPANQQGTLLIPRFGQLLPVPDVGFDVLQVRMRADEEGRNAAAVKTFLKKVPRPLDIHISGGKVYLCEYTRQISGDSGSWLPGALLELTPVR
jgi:glucose/arabinose dehydrogenase